MAKKKKTTKKKTTKKKRTRKAPGAVARSLTPLIQAYQADVACALHRKILAIAAECPEIEATGEYQSERQGEGFKFTIYYDVRKAVDPLLIKYHLTFIGYADKDHQTHCWYDGHGYHYATTYFKLTDADTGYGVIVPGFGMGMNRFWALDSARTLACKHALLETLMIKWDNRDATKALIQKSDSMIADIVTAVMEKIADRQTPLSERAAVQEIKNHDWLDKQQPKK